MEINNILSLFDGMSCGQIAINKLGIKYKNYFASEIDKHSIKVCLANYPNTKQLGSVTDVKSEDLPQIDLLIGGSPCQSFSFAGKQKGMSTKCNEEILTLQRYKELKKGGFEFEGQSYLFWEYVRILKETKPKYFFLENVMMSEKWEKLISKTLGVNPIMINSSLVSAQNRKRLYWTNIGLETDKTDLFGGVKSIIKQPEDKGILLKDILEKEVDSKYFLSDKMISFFEENSKKMKEKGNGFRFEPTKGDKKSKTLTTLNGSRMDDNFIKIIPCDQGFKEIKEKQNGKTGTLTARAREDESCGQLVKIEYAFAYTEQRTEEAKQERKEHKAKTGKDFCSRRGKELVPRYDNKMNTLTTTQSNESIINDSMVIRRLTPIECERLQTVPYNYTNHVSDSQRYKMLGNGWTIDVIAHVLNYIK